MKSVHLHCLLVSSSPDLPWKLEHLLGGVAGLRFTLNTVKRPEATSAYEMKRFDILLVEITAAERGCIAEFRALYPDLPIVALTSSHDDQVGLLAAREGAHDYLSTEDLNGEALLRTLRYTQERCRVERALRLNQQQMFQTQKMEAIGRTASGLSHQFRQAVQVILSNASVLSELHRGEQETGLLVKEIEFAVHSATRLVDQFMGFAGEQSGTNHGCLNQVIKRHEEMLRSMTTGHSLTLSLAEEQLSVSAPRAEIAQLLFNLLGNSVDASEPPGQILISTRLLELSNPFGEGLLALTPGSYAVLTVADHGSGISEEARERVFEPFFTTKRKGQDSGLGLTMTFNFCQRHRVGMDLWSRVGVGTAVRLVFPLDGRPVGGSTTLAEFTRGHLLLLWIQDTRLIMTLRSSLGDEDWNILEVQAAADVEEFLTRETRFTLVCDLSTCLENRALISSVQHRVVVSPWPTQIDCGPLLVSPFSRQQLLERLSVTTQPEQSTA